MRQECFFFHYYLANSMTDWAEIITGLLFCAYVEIQQLPIVSTVFKQNLRPKVRGNSYTLCIIFLNMQQNLVLYEPTVQNVFLCLLCWNENSLPPFNNYLRPQLTNYYLFKSTLNFPSPCTPPFPNSPNTEKFSISNNLYSKCLLYMFEQAMSHGSWIMVWSML